MVNRHVRRALIVVLMATLGVVGLATPALGQGTTPPPTAPHPNPPGPPPPSPPADPNRPPVSGSSGASQHTTVRSCSVYATASSFGLSCLDGSGTSPTINEILGGKDKPAPTCWDTPVTPEELAEQYPDYPVVPDSTYYVLSCIDGLVRTDPVTQQPGAVLSQHLILIHNGGTDDCKAPFTEAQKLGNDQTCIMKLTDPQQTVINYFQRRGAQIPSVTIATYPSTTVRTRVKTTFADQVPTCQDCQSPTRTKNQDAGGVTMYAKMTKYRIYPYGPDKGTAGSTCNAAASLGPDGTSSDAPACTFTYPRSSNGRHDNAFPFRAEATWSVYIVGRDEAFATFHKFTDIGLPVPDVQTLVVPGAG